VGEGSTTPADRTERMLLALLGRTSPAEPVSDLARDLGLPAAQVVALRNACRAGAIRGLGARADRTRALVAEIRDLRRALEAVNEELWVWERIVALGNEDGEDDAVVRVRLSPGRQV
jgi:hypothetical protein